MLRPTYADASAGLAEALKRSGRSAEAEAQYAAMVTSGGGLVSAEAAHLTNFGVLLLQKGDALSSELAERLMRTALRLDPTQAVALSNLATAVQRSGQISRAFVLYTRALRLEPASPLFMYNLANINYHFGVTSDARRLALAVNGYTDSISHSPMYVAAINNLGNALKEASHFVSAMRAWRTALILSPASADIFANIVHLRLHLCLWDADGDRSPQYMRSLLATLGKQLRAAEADVPADRLRSLADNTVATLSVQPFHALLYANISAALCLRIAAHSARDVLAQLSTARVRISTAWNWRPVRPFHIGYVSSDLGDHPTGHLFRSVPIFHDRARVVVHLFLKAAHDGSTVAEDIRAHADQLHPLLGLTFVAAAALINTARLHVLVDLDMWMRGRWPEVLALRPAAVQVAYLGYPGSAGSEWLCAIGADRYVAPPEYAPHFSEKLLFLPHSYQVNDFKQRFASISRSVPPELEQRSSPCADCAPTVLANFNQLYKLDRATLRTWVRLVHGARERGRVKLWLLRFPEEAVAAVQQELRALGAAEEVVWSERASREEHIGRCGAADLFLDNFHVNAHSTCSETLWAEVPVVTAAGEGWCSRVASSLLLVLGLDELVCRDRGEYAKLAAALVANKSALAALSRKVRSKKMTSMLFDTRRWVRDWERTLMSLWESNVFLGGRAVNIVTVALS